jgi:glutathione synthase/RimK-type ligase-like ATP-grasp enzyme
VSILRAANKVFLAQLMERHRIPQPKTLLIHRGNIAAAAREQGFPCVLKQPDSQFSKGVIKVESEAEFKRRSGPGLERWKLSEAAFKTQTLVPGLSGP